jgi:hypothetical protein
MSGRKPEHEGEMERAAAAMLAKDGYHVEANPDLASLPFDLRGYRPDLIATRNDEKLIVEVKGSVLRASIDRYREIAELISSYPGWRFVLVTPDDIPNVGASRILGWDGINRRRVEGTRLLEMGQTSAAFLLLWTALEAAMRRQARESHSPAERLPLSSLVKHLYSSGELSMEQYERANSYLQTRNQVAHGYEVPHLDQECQGLGAFLDEVIAYWAGTDE